MFIIEEAEKGLYTKQLRLLVTQLTPIVPWHFVAIPLAGKFDFMEDDPVYRATNPDQKLETVTVGIIMILRKSGGLSDAWVRFPHLEVEASYFTGHVNHPGEKPKFIQDITKFMLDKLEKAGISIDRRDHVLTYSGNWGHSNVGARLADTLQSRLIFNSFRIPLEDTSHLAK